jgi:hypothetical protein
VSVSISASGPFEVPTDTCPETLSGFAISPMTCSISVVFRPTAVGFATGTLSTGGPTAELLGTGIEAARPQGQESSPVPPSNRFAFGKLKLHRRQGTATLPVELPGPGVLALDGKRIAGAVIAKASGTVKLGIRATGRARSTLERAGGVTVTARVTFAPTGGVAATQTKRIRLKEAGG